MATRTPLQRTRDEQLVEQALLGQLLPPHDLREHTKVVGVTATNLDGTSRQDIIWRMTQFDFVDLQRNRYDEWDSNAVQVFATVGGARAQIGHLDKDLARLIAPRMDAGEPWRAITTRVGGKISRGVSLMLFRTVQTSAPAKLRSEATNPERREGPRVSKPVALCAHVMPTGATCGCPALRAQQYCFHHKKSHA